MLLVKSNIIPFKGYKAINLFGIVFYRKPLTEIDINHEAIHTALMKELLYIGFYIFYIIEWFLKLVYYRNSHLAYMNISFEKEAYSNQENLQYLKTRKMFQLLIPASP